MPELLRSIARAVWHTIEFNLLCLHRKDVYLRKKGAIIGDGCNLIPDLANFGSEPYLIRIGDRVTITAGVRLVTHDASTRLFRDRYPNMNARFGNLYGPIRIGSNCFVGVNTVLLPNTVIGDNSIVGAGAVVKGEFPAESVIAGVPARRIGSLDEYIASVQEKMIPLQAQTEDELRRELLERFNGDQGR